MLIENFYLNDHFSLTLRILKVKKTLAGLLLKLYNHRPCSFILGYGSPIDEFINDEMNKTRLYILTGGNAQQRLIKMLEYKRVAVIIEDELIIESYTKKSTHIRFAGTL